MFARLKDWVYAYKVLKKYKLKYSPNCEKGQGTFNIVTKTVTVNPFDDHFLDILMHEVGHFIYDKKVGVHDNESFDSYYISEALTDLRDKNRCLFKLLDSEMFASNFATKSGRNRYFLRKHLNGYTKGVFMNRELFEKHDRMDLYNGFLDAVAHLSKIFYREEQ